MWDWELMNDIKPIWQRPAKDVEEDEYKAFYKTFSKVSTSAVVFHLTVMQIVASTSFNFTNSNYVSLSNRTPTTPWPTSTSWLRVRLPSSPSCLCPLQLPAACLTNMAPRRMTSSRYASHSSIQYPF